MLTIAGGIVLGFLGIIICVFVFGLLMGLLQIRNEGNLNTPNLTPINKATEVSLKVNLDLSESSTFPYDNSFETLEEIQSVIEMSNNQLELIAGSQEHLYCVYDSKTDEIIKTVKSELYDYKIMSGLVAA